MKQKPKKEVGQHEKSTPKKTESTGGTNGTLKILTSIFKELGAIGFIIVMGSAIFLLWGTKAQKEEFIDKFLLFKDAEKNIFPFSIVVVILVLIIIITIAYCRVKHKIYKEQIL